MPVSPDKDGLAVVIVGAGHAGGSAAALLRQSGHKGPLTLVGDEPSLPYQRPPLSKAYLKGELTEDRLLLRPPSFYAQNGIAVRSRVRAAEIDRVGHGISLDDGQTLHYDKLVLATGSEPRRLDASMGGGLAGVLTLRNLHDVDCLKPELRVDGRALIVGAGYIGLEAAAVLRTLGMHVTVIEAEGRVLARVAGPELSEFYQEHHRAHGVDLRLGTRLSHLAGAAGHVASAVLDDGSRLDVNLVLVGIGVRPGDDLARQAGLRCDNGVEVDEDARTSDPDIYAIGDCSSRPLIHYGRRGRLESVHNALEQARLATHHMLGLARPRCEVPWFWSDQYDLKLQTAGLLAGHDQTIVRGDMSARKFAIYYLRGRRLQAVDAVNAMADFMCGKRLAGSGADLDLDAIRDPSRDPRTF